MQALVCSSRWLAAALSPDALIVSLSASAEQFTGYSAQELIGKPITRILADHSAFEMPQILNAVKEWGNWEGKLIHCTRSGRSLEAHGAMMSLAGKGSLPAGFLFMSNLNESPAINAGDNEAVASIAASLRAFVHDLNNPLAVIMGFAQLLELNSNCKGKVRADIEKLSEELKHLAHIIERLHGYAIALDDKPKILIPDSGFLIPESELLTSDS
jgi:PAS domain S-box-containing protein